MTEQTGKPHDLKLPFNKRVCRCSVCGDYFGSETAFDAHRTGPYDRNPDGTTTRRCLSAEERRASGLWLDDNGYWRGEKLGPKRRSREVTA